jgi:mono/diheme cytochrome c family protein
MARRRLVLLGRWDALALLGLRVALALLAPAALGCSEGEPGDPAAAEARRGEQVFLNNCTACHARDPRQAGPIGPPVAGSSLDLLEAKVLHNEYPPGYTPKRDTRAMIPLPHLEPELPALAAYLAKAAAQ